MQIKILAVNLYLVLDRISGFLIFTTALSGPWAFGSAPSQTIAPISIQGISQAWPVWLLISMGYLTGFCLLGKVLLRRFTNAIPIQPSSCAFNFVTDYKQVRYRPTFMLACLTLLIIGFVVTSCINHRSIFNDAEFSFKYVTFIKWLPHTFDKSSTMRFLINLIGLTFIFWAIFDWINEPWTSAATTRRHATSTTATQHIIPSRLLQLLWILTLNGGLLALESILQRISGTNKLLWLVSTHLNSLPEYQMGPYAYRANAAQYFNLLWPVSLGFWWWTQKQSRSSKIRIGIFSLCQSHLILICTGLMAACPIISGSRAGAVLDFTALAACTVILIRSTKSNQGTAKLSLFLLVLLIAGFGLYLGGDYLAQRMQDFHSNLVQREQIYSAARDMSKEHPLFGTGPGTFEILFQFYRNSPDDYWPAQLHNDWLETLITFGWLGSSLIWLALSLVLLRWFIPGGIPCPWQFATFLWIGLSTCLLHARFDYPFQIPSITALFLMLCAILFSFSRPASS